MPRSIRFYIRNRWVESGAVISSSGALANYPASNTQAPDLDESWRSPGLTGQYLAANLGQQRKIGAIVIVKPNLTSAGFYRARIANTPTFSSVIYDSGTRTRARYFSDAEILTAKTSEFFDGGVPNVDTRKKLQRQVIIIELPSEVSGQYIQIDLNDVTNPDGYIEVGTVFAGRILQPTNDLMFNWKIQRDHIVRDGQAACGQYWSASVRHKTLVEFSLAPQRETDILAYWFLLQSLVGINDPFVISLTDRTDSLNFTTSLYAKFVVVPTITASAYRHYTMPMQIEEIVG